MEEHMYMSDCFPKESNIRPACNVINCEVFFKADLPDDSAVEKLVKENLLSFVRFSAVPDVKCHGWKMVDVDLADHVFTHDPVKDRQELDTEVDKIINEDLPSDKPLWQVHFLPAAVGAQQKNCVVFRCHHTVADGLTLVQLLDKVATTPDGEPVTFVNYKAKKPVVFGPIKKFFFNILYCLEWVRSFVSNMHEGSLPLETSFGFNAPLSHRSGDMKYSGDRKSICFKPFSVDYVKAIKNKAPGKITVNDVLLGAMVGAMRRYGGAAVDNNTIMRILIPVGAPIDFGPNPPPEGDRLGNNWSFASADLSKAIRADGPLARLEETDGAMNRLKKSLDSTTSNFISNKLMPLYPLRKAQEATRAIYSRHTAIFSNVPGPTQPCCIGGKQIEAIYPIFLTLVEQVIVMSYNGQFYFNTTVDPNVVTDYDKFEGYYREELLDLGKRLGITDVQL
ncbi:conserved hypothetical protein [Perkinsus marinus ATCC 50983]|uniref:Uncharacterized protein n=1 Tax=Perkinsus marinus (strain ATCC 50983 / TXsc) TaxID=423536 RepID=C5KD05_PERM5|nr:conserved hypothetical protein [Perkinsus marinus ATCC 50983]EER17754.1 conserved hypothetical protein [Perkinsus marinus ATCC 50983]|eukprot:XP_002785958.1 conserved hypothetical protein [Perkinsus marinus ATCC 50983]